MRIAALAEIRGVRVIPHCWASDILVAATSQVLSTFQDAPYLEFNATENPLKTKLLSEPIHAVDGYVSISDKPGLGIELDESTVAEFTSC
jgi:D-galactarolactone cycloisomerase